MLITCDTDLRKYLPNALATVEGESSLYDKLDFFLAASERWLAEHFTGTTVLVEISAMDAATPIRMLACQIVVVCRRMAVADEQLVESQFHGKPAESFSLDNLASGVGEESFPLGIEVSEY